MAQNALVSLPTLFHPDAYFEENTNNPPILLIQIHPHLVYKVVFESKSNAKCSGVCFLPGILGFPAPPAGLESNTLPSHPQRLTGSA